MKQAEVHRGQAIKPEYPATVGFPNFQRTYVGRGGQHVVWEDEYYDSLGDPAVSKLDFSNLVLDDEVARQALYVEAGNRDERHRQLRQQFGLKRVPFEDFGVKVMYVNADQLSFMRPDLAEAIPPGKRRSISVIQSLQDYVEELRPENRQNNLYLTADYAERSGRVFSTEDYTLVNDHFVLGFGKYTDDIVKRFWAVQGNDDLWKLAQEAQHNTRVHHELSTVIAECINYAHTEGYILDLSKDNVFLTQDGAAKLVDALYPQDLKLIHLLGETLHKVKAHELLTFQDSINLLNGRKYVCTINFFAAYCGLSSRLTIPGAPAWIGKGWERTLDTLQRLSKRHQLGALTVASAAKFSDVA